MHKLVSIQENKTQNSLGFRDTNRSHNLSLKSRPNEPIEKKEKKKNCRIANFAVPTDHKIKRIQRRVLGPLQ